MLLSSNVLVTIDSKDAPDFMTPIPLIDEDVTREHTIFHLISNNNSVSIMGTFDEILGYASKIMASMYSWPLVAGRGSEWFANDQDELERVIGNGTDGTSVKGHGGNGGSSPGEEWLWQ
jgi:hypothetical protein